MEVGDVVEIESILNSIKDYCNVSESETDFDNELLMYTNNAFVLLSQIGVGPSIPFIVSDDQATWAELDVDETLLPMVKNYIYLKVRMLFDAPQNSSLNTAMKESAAEYEWRLNLFGDHSFESV